ncbi:MAG: iron-sulfur cluster assembly scaffold protein [Patescibacteria group bacterium]|jgi:NifU-like protein involved in Fe-S cluster formation
MDYTDLIALAKSTTHVGALDCANAVGEATNASCGDFCKVWLKIVGGKIEVMQYEATGCVISRAAAAVLAGSVIGPIGLIGPMSGNHIRELLSVPISPLRERCLTTALVALQNALKSYEA